MTREEARGALVMAAAKHLGLDPMYVSFYVDLVLRSDRDLALTALGAVEKPCPASSGSLPSGARCDGVAVKVGPNAWACRVCGGTGRVLVFP